MKIALVWSKKLFDCKIVLRSVCPNRDAYFSNQKLFLNRKKCSFRVQTHFLRLIKQLHWPHRPDMIGLFMYQNRTKIEPVMFCWFFIVHGNSMCEMFDNVQLDSFENEKYGDLFWQTHETVTFEMKCNANNDDERWIEKDEEENSHWKFE